MSRSRATGGQRLTDAMLCYTIPSSGVILEKFGLRPYSLAKRGLSHFYQSTTVHALFSDQLRSSWSLEWTPRL